MSEGNQKFRASHDAIRRVVVAFGRFRWRWTVLHSWGKFGAIGAGLLLTWILIDWLAKLPLLVLLHFEEYWDSCCKITHKELFFQIAEIDLYDILLTL